MNNANIDTIDIMERQYNCRYERGLSCTFPVTHVITRPDGAVCYGHVTVCNSDLLNWSIRDATGKLIVYSAERNYSCNRIGYERMIRYALRHMRAYGAAKRVYPRDSANRKRPARTSSEMSWHR